MYEQNYFTAIIFFNDKPPWKYRNIPKGKFEKLKTFAITKGATHINFYNKITKQFYEQHKLGNNNIPTR